MKKVGFWSRRFTGWLAWWLIFLGTVVQAQNARVPGIPGVDAVGVPSKPLNFTHFTAKKRLIDSAWLSHNPGMASHPDAGRIAAEQPDSNAIEVLEKRTETSRYYVDGKNPGRVFSQSAYGALHYKKNGQWLLIDRRLEQKSQYLLEAPHQEEPVGFDLKKQESYIKTGTGTVSFNHWKLYGGKGKVKKLLATADWSNCQAGDDGVLVRDIFPGVDAEMRVERGEVKSSLIVRKWEFPGYEKYFFEDTYQHAKGTALHFPTNKKLKSGVGKLALSVDGKKLAAIGKAFAYVSGRSDLTVDLPYQLEGANQSIVLSENVLGTLLEAGSFVIDPTVTGARSELAQAGHLNSHFDGDNSNCTEDRFAESCSYGWKLQVPGAITVTKLYFDARVEALAPCAMKNLFYKYRIGTGNCGLKVYWIPEVETNEGNKPGFATVEKRDVDNYNNCLQPTCDPTAVDIRLSIMRKCMGTAGCGADCVRGVGPFVVTVEGETLRAAFVLPAAETEICNGEEVRLATKAAFGIVGSGYGYVWTPGGFSGETLTVKPAKTTDYTVTLSDACGKVTEKVKVKVLSDPPKTETSKLTGCGKVSFNGTDYTESIMLKESIKGASGCDSLIRETEIVVYPGKVTEESRDLSGCEFVDYKDTRYTQSTVLDEVYKNALGCDSLHRVINITVQPLEAELLSSSDPASVFLGEVVTLTPKVNRDEFTVVSWEPGSLFDDPTAPKQTVVVNQDATYTVYIESEDGCDGSATVRLMGKDVPGSTLYPSSFTPNGDGINDVWKPIRDADELEVWVYSRWGEVVFHMKGGSREWDGTYKGQPVPAGTYTYRLMVHGRYNYSGMVNVVY
ncbi:hypothetical protein GCM10023091_12970 [Ravibacter arvi]|uniref:Gliding motility-associated C-terminal domain-containing protein n=1 Tax=Ravibacter arvi TaxID=2051041 RepID=A0ABP8LSP7_9BACT